MRNAVAFRFSGDTGRLLENCVLIELLRRKKSVYFFKDNRECDFVTGENGRVTAAIQVCFELTPENRERETGGLASAMAVHGLSEGLLLTYGEEETIEHDDRIIRVIPAWKWLIGSESDSR